MFYTNALSRTRMTHMLTAAASDRVTILPDFILMAHTGDFKRDFAVISNQWIQILRVISIPRRQ